MPSKIFALLILMSIIVFSTIYMGSYLYKQPVRFEIESVDYKNTSIFQKLVEKLDRLANKIDKLDGDIKTIGPTENEADVIIFDLGQPLLPKDVYDPIKCRNAMTFHSVSPILCAHDPKIDIYVSGNILGAGAWEANIVGEYMRYVTECTECLVFDLGANVGQYSLYAAKAGRKVISIEPFHDNILRIHKASYLDNTTSRITLIKNGLWDKRNEIKLLEKDPVNIGGQSLINNINRTFSESDFKNSTISKYLVKTILLDDVIDYLPLRDNNQKYQKALMKIDIQSFEPFAFKRASKLFDHLNFTVILMEWMTFPTTPDIHADVEEMIDFFYKRNFLPFNGGTLLSRNEWKKTWPADMIWKKINRD